MKLPFSGAFVAALILAPNAAAQLTPYSEDCESYDAANGAVLTDAGWLGFVNVFDAGGGFAYNYGVFGAPNGTGAISEVAGGLGGPDQGLQYLNIFSDYNNGDHGNGSNNRLETNVFREQVIDAANAGETWTFEFDYLKNPFMGPNGDGDTTTFAFVKVLQQSNGSFATLAFPTVDTTGASTSAWTTGSIDITIDPAWAGELLQIGFLSNCDNFEDSGRFYDNISFSGGSTPQPPSLEPYAQDFEALDIANGASLTDDGWLVFANVFNNSDGSFAYGYGVFGAPNGGPGFSAIATGDGGPPQGAQYLNAYSDYNNADHGNNRTINALVFQEQEIGAVDAGNTWRFQFDQRKNPNTVNGDGATTTQAFIKVLQRSNGSFATLFLNEFDSTNISDGVWSSMALDITIDPSWAGELIQFGFSSFATNFEDSGRFYDNITWGTVDPGLGKVVCIGNPNSTGGDALLTANGSTAVADNNLTLDVAGLPANVMGLFFQSPTGVTVYNPAGSQGHLCIASFDIGRFPMVMMSDAAGNMSQSVDLNALPGPMGALMVMPGETRLFQCWHRDMDGMTATSNFTSAVCITFQ